jgi:hypothetical protein
MGWVCRAGAASGGRGGTGPNVAQRRFSLGYVTNGPQASPNVAQLEPRGRRVTFGPPAPREREMSGMGP